ncbi:MAG: diguanylate cyclase [Actinobacteria bacterium]|nr:diguanylate cyclase [Actinomycetota bacterium]
MKVLIVDDSPDALTVAKARLLKEGLEVICADGGRAGLEAARVQHPDLILLDVDMPDISGFDLCQQLKADAELGMIPVIFLTGSSTTADRVKGLDIGAVDYVTKPFDAFELRARVRAALRTKHLQDLLIKHARLDPLTELPNRRALMERLQQESSLIQRHDGSLSFIMADIDHFKQVNDTHGHSAGDRLLQRVAQAIVGQCRQTDLPARYGGEEFAVIVPGEDASDAFYLADRCRRAVEAVTLELGPDTLRTTASFGVADATGSSSGQDLIQAADEALYRAKQLGRNRVELAAHTSQPAHLR